MPEILADSKLPPASAPDRIKIGLEMSESGWALMLEGRVTPSSRLYLREAWSWSAAHAGSGLTHARLTLGRDPGAVMGLLWRPNHATAWLWRGLGLLGHT
ncbi:hypothetical protein PIB30_018177 [Stylosanthes scabra]|uniref:Uncharacterized protein n=1 Tax=Stylosanthes scabra TaxID=79078 RepID=A0ABU6S7U4_9FABA|nr:hypothetical protein [Stylosanthes scabra]